MRAVVLESNMAGLEEFGETWFACITAKMSRMTLCADWIVLLLDLPTVEGQTHHPSGFDPYERALIKGAAKILPNYHQYYLAYLTAVQNKELVAAIKASPPLAGDANIYSHYTVVSHSQEGGYQAEPFGSHFKEDLAGVLSDFDAWIADCENAEQEAAVGPGWDKEMRPAYTAFLKQYKKCLGSAAPASPEALEEAWTELDRLWMDTKGPIQLLHDIETVRVRVSTNNVHTW